MPKQAVQRRLGGLPVKFLHPNGGSVEPTVQKLKPEVSAQPVLSEGSLFGKFVMNML
jgi:hypothetical protein